MHLGILGIYVSVAEQIFIVIAVQIFFIRKINTFDQFARNPYRFL